MRARVWCFAIILSLAAVAQAGRDTIYYQGQLLSAADLQGEQGYYPMRVRIYDVPDGGAPRWEETRDVEVVRGLFSRPLGEFEPLGDLFSTADILWMEVSFDLDQSGQFEDDEVYGPRQQMGAAAWAKEAGTLDGMHSYDFWAITGNDQIDPARHFLGTRNNAPLQLATFSRRALRLEPGASGPNVIGGYVDNVVTTGVSGAVIGGGGGAATGGGLNRVSDDYGTIGGGVNNVAGDRLGTVSDSRYATVGGGYDNWASGEYATVSGGWNNRTSQDFATIGGGRDNTASDYSATVAGGYSNAATGGGAAIPGGSFNTASGDLSFAAGYRAKAVHDGSFVWTDNTGDNFSSLRDRQFRIRAIGGVSLNVNLNRWVEIYDVNDRLINTSLGAYLGTDGVWHNSSDRASKENFGKVDPRSVLERVAALPIATWNRKGCDPADRHIGPVAQDFHAAFGFGLDDKSIATADADGVSLAAIQGLYEMVKEKDTEIEKLKADKHAQERRIIELEERLAARERQTFDFADRLAALERRLEPRPKY